MCDFHVTTKQGGIDMGYEFFVSYRLSAFVLNHEPWEPDWCRYRLATACKLHIVCKFGL